MNKEIKEVEEIKPRSVGELLQLDTFQDMTDAEINSIIDYKITMALLDDEREQDIKERRAQQAIGAQVMAEAQLTALNIVAQALNFKPELKVIPYE